VERPETLYVRSGDAYLGYQTFGTGSFAIVALPGRISNIELIWDNPDSVEFYAGLARFSRVVVLDRRGVGVSDRPAGGAALEQQVEDVRVVMDAAGVDRACLWGSRDGAALAAMFAGVHPARVACLLLWQPNARGAWAPDYPWGLKESELPPGGLEYTSPAVVDQAMRSQYPTKCGDAEFRRRFIRTMRLSASPSSYAALRRVWLDSDVRHILGSIQAPTLVMHGSVMDVNESRYVAERIPLTTLLEFPEVETISPVFGGDAERPIQAMHAFIADVWDDAERQSRRDRVLATVLFTDLVGSTEQAVALGPDWQEQMRKHNSTTRRELAHFRGREIDSAGDGFFASGFDGPAQAIRCGWRHTGRDRSARPANPCWCAYRRMRHRRWQARRGRRRDRRPSRCPGSRRRGHRVGRRARSRRGIGNRVRAAWDPGAQRRRRLGSVLGGDRVTADDRASSGESLGRVFRNDTIGLRRAVHAQEHQGRSRGHRP
jgi:pimeloyl-ACP methyl ester carboxylesterase/class 3 adenylate cyclase